MAAFLRRPRAYVGPALGKLLSLSDQPRSGGGVLAGTLLRSPEAMGGWRGGGDASITGVAFSSWAGGAGAWRYQPYRRPRLAEWGDWACLGLTALAGGLFWTSRTSREEVPLRMRLLQIVLVYRALRYSLKRKLLRLKLKWLRHKLIVKGVILQELEREHEACLGEVDILLQALEDFVFYKMENVTKQVSIDGDDPFLISASMLLRRIEELKVFVSRKPEGCNDSFVHMDSNSERAERLVVKLSRFEVLVSQLVESHAVNEVRIIRNKELVAKVDEMLLNLEKEK